MCPCHFVHDLCLCGQPFDGALSCYASLTSLCTCLYKCRNSRKLCSLEIHMYPCHVCCRVSMTCVCGQPFDGNDRAIGQDLLFDCVATIISCKLGLRRRLSSEFIYSVLCVHFLIFGLVVRLEPSLLLQSALSFMADCPPSTFIMFGTMTGANIIGPPLAPSPVPLAPSPVTSTGGIVGPTATAAPPPRPISTGKITGCTCCREFVCKMCV